MINWSIKTLSIKSLKNHPKNPRTLSKDQYQHLKNSIEKYGLADKPILNKDLTIIGGHQRVRIMKELGHKEIDCWIPDIHLSEKDVEEFNIRLNKNSGTFDYDTLANEFEALELLEWGFSEDDLIGKFDDFTLDEEKPQRKKKAKNCPNCGVSL